MNRRLQPTLIRGLTDLSLKAFLLALFAFLVALVPSSAQAQSASMRGFVYQDLNGNGVRDIGEPPKTGAQFHMSRMGGETMIFRSNQEGFFGDQSLPGGEYLLGLPIGRNIQTRYPGADIGAPMQVELNPGSHLELPDFGFQELCFEYTNVKILCDTQNPGCFIVTLDVTNLTNFPIGHMYFLQGAPVVVQSINPPSNAPNYIPFNPPLGPNQTQTISFRICGAQPLTSLCLDVSVHSPDMIECCLGQFCFKLPDCDCFQILDETWECNPDGSYTWCFTLQSLVPANMSPAVNWLTIVPPAGVTMSQVVFPLNPPLAFGQTVQICVTVSGVTPGQQYCFRVGLADRFFRECCAKNVYTTFPPCNVCTPGECCSQSPHYGDGPGHVYQNWVPFVGKTVAAVTMEGVDPALVGWPANQYPLRLVNLENYQTTPPPMGLNWAPSPLSYTGPSISPQTTWDYRQLGSIFGVTIDSRGNIFVTATVCYLNDLAIMNSAGRQVMVFKVESGLGIVRQFVSTGPGGIPNSGVAMGNITFDCENDQLFTTNMEDGKIYRITGLGSNTGTVAADIYDPFGADNGQPGEAPLGERLWGIQMHADGRLYFSRWVKDSCHTGDIADYAGNSLTRNEIWSVALNGAGQIDGTTLQKEFDMPGIGGNTNWSNPVSDIQFDLTGKMMTAERSMCNTTDYATHQSRGVEWECDPAGQGWLQVGAPNDLFFQVGSAAPTNLPYGACGGTDYDYSPLTSANANSGRRVWFTGDIVDSSPNWIYGLKGIPLGGGDDNNSIIMEIIPFSKTTHGDVELPCPPQGLNVSVLLGDYTANPNNMGLTATLGDSAGNTVLTAPVTLDAASRFSLILPHDFPAGNYTLGVKGKCWLRKAVNVHIDESGMAPASVALINGDVDDDNEVGPADFGLLSSAFGTSVGDPGFLLTADLDGDGEVGPADFSILSANFGQVGD